MVLVGLSKEDQAVEVELERTRLPDSRREAEETERGGVGVPDGVGRAVEEAESAGGEEAEGGGRVNWGGASSPDGDAAGVEDGGDEGVGGVDGEEAEGEGGVWRGPCLAWVGSVES